MKARDIPTGMPFRFAGTTTMTDASPELSKTIYIAQGRGWYNTPEGFSGGPWCDAHDNQQEVEAVKCTLHSHSFDGFNDMEMSRLHDVIDANAKGQYTDGDLALAEREMADRGLTQ